VKNLSKDDLYSNRLTLTELRNLVDFSEVSDEEGEALLDDALALARMILDIIN
jgi:hypothetical protein